MGYIASEVWGGVSGLNIRKYKKALLYPFLNLSRKYQDAAGYRGGKMLSLTPSVSLAHSCPVFGPLRPDYSLANFRQERLHSKKMFMFFKGFSKTFPVKKVKDYTLL